MRKIIRLLNVLFLALALFLLSTLIADNQTLKNDIIRLHVVGASDSDQDQNIKLAVKDAITDYIEKNLDNVSNAQQAKACLQEHMSEIKTVAANTLMRLGSCDSVNISLAQEAFGIRRYETFSLPSGVYESLRVEIGKAEGKNWWCVVFPSLCLPASQDGFQDVAASAGMNPGLANSLSNNREYNIRFFLLDCLGKFENLFFFS